MFDSSSSKRLSGVGSAPFGSSLARLLPSFKQRLLLRLGRGDSLAARLLDPHHLLGGREARHGRMKGGDHWGEKATRHDIPRRSNSVNPEFLRQGLCSGILAQSWNIGQTVAKQDRNKGLSHLRIQHFGYR